ncbi:MAG: hypothetical protein SOR57_02635 [Parabacteroides sp.]|nr:hypothetical protein [Parabacteroides sp.]
MTKGSKADEIMTLVFMVFAIAAIASYIYSFSSPDKTIFLCCAGAAIIMRVVQYLLRFFHK